MAKRMNEGYDDKRDALIEYMQENYPDDVPMEMSELDSMLDSSSPSEAIEKAFYGNDYGNGGEGQSESFNPNRDWFTFDGYANLVSIDENLLDDYLADYEGDSFEEWCKNNGHEDLFDDEDEEEDDEDEEKEESVVTSDDSRVYESVDSDKQSLSEDSDVYSEE